jgi:hypothetical protein
MLNACVLLPGLAVCGEEYILEDEYLGKGKR